MRPRTKRVFILHAIAIVLSSGLISDVFADYQKNLASVDRALLNSLQGLKESMASVENANEALRMENNSYARRIQGMKEALGRTEIDVKPVQAAQDEVQHLDEKAIRLTEKTLARIIEEYQALNNEHTDLERRIKAKEEILVDFYGRAVASQRQAEVIQSQIAVMESFSGAELQKQIQNLENLFRESQNNLIVQQQEEVFSLKPESVKVVSDSEMVNKEFWSKMQNLESDLRTLSDQSAQVYQDQSIEQKHREDMMAGLSAETLSLAEQLRLLQEEIKSSPIPSEMEAPEDQVLKDYYQHLKQQNQELHQRAVSLRNVLPDL